MTPYSVCTALLGQFFQEKARLHGEQVLQRETVRPDENQILLVGFDHPNSLRCERKAKESDLLFNIYISNNKSRNARGFEKKKEKPYIIGREERIYSSHG